jgi:hypothetical protein
MGSESVSLRKMARKRGQLKETSQPVEIEENSAHSNSETVEFELTMAARGSWRNLSQ